MPEITVEFHGVEMVVDYIWHEYVPPGKWNEEEPEGVEDITSIQVNGVEIFGLCDATWTLKAWEDLCGVIYIARTKGA